MTYENFESFVKMMEIQSDLETNVSNLGVTLFDFNDRYHTIIYSLMREIWTDEGVDWMNWFMWESDFGEKNWQSSLTYKYKEGSDRVIEIDDNADEFGAHDENGNPICYDIKSLYEHIKQYEK
jgi:hypothetical protein